MGTWRPRPRFFVPRFRSVRARDRTVTQLAIVLALAVALAALARRAIFA